MNFIIFFAIFFTIYGLVNYYIFIRGWQAIPSDSSLRIPYLALFLLVSLSFIGGRFLERIWLTPVSEALVWTGSFWLAAMAYCVLALLLLDLLRGTNALVPWFPAWVTQEYGRTKLVTGGVVILTVGILLAYGHVNASTPRIKELTISLRKTMRGTSAMRIVAASDIHLGTIIGRTKFNRIVQKINDLGADLVLLPGDILDEDLGPVIKENLGEMLRSIRSRYGVVAVTGNHEYIGGVEEAYQYLTDHGVLVLRDSVVQLPNGVQVVGREDRSISQFTGKGRRPLGQLVEGIDREYPVVMMDHQPFHLEEAAGNGIDLQLSGHTHHGQLWPFNIITNAIYDLSWGSMQRDGVHYYVSSGVGTWGPPVRIGNHPEIVVITLTTE